MIKRSVLVALIAITSGASARHVHSQNHYDAHYAPYNAAEAARIAADEAVDTAAIQVRDTNFNVSNANICSFYTDYTLYVLKPIISYAYSYNISNSGEEIDFNICNPLVNPNPSCQGAFACLKDAQGTYHPLSGSDFGTDIKGLVPEENRPGDTKKGGLTLYYEGSKDTCKEGVNYKMNLNLYCDDSHDRDMDNNDISEI